MILLIIAMHIVIVIVCANDLIKGFEAWLIKTVRGRMGFLAFGWVSFLHLPVSLGFNTHRLGPADVSV
jgi:hypothetical protein